MINRSPIKQLSILRLDEQWARAGIFGTLVSVLIAAAYSMLRIGLQTPPTLAPLAACIVAAGAFGPLLLPYKWIFAESKVRSVIYPIVTFSIFSSVLMAFWAATLMEVFYPLIALTGLARAWYILRGSRSNSILSVGGHSLILLGISAYLFIYVNNLGYAGVYTPESGLLGTLNHDTRFHAAIAFLIQRFGEPSLGADGLLPLHYHYGSHFWFAALGRLAGSEPLWSYGAGVLVFAVPALFLSLLLAGIAIDQGRKPFLEYLVIGMFLLVLSDVIGWSSYYISESYTFGLIGFLLFIPMMSRIADGGTHPMYSLVGILGGALVIPVLMSLKVSVGLLWGLGLAFLVLRRFGFGLHMIGASIVLIGGVATGMKMFTPSPGDYVHTTEAFWVPFYLLREYPVGSTLSSFVLPISLALITLFSNRAGVRELIISRNDLLLEICIVITLIGAIPAFVGIPQDSAVWYFMNVGQWFAMALLVSRISLADLKLAISTTVSTKLGGAMIFIMASIFFAQVVEHFSPVNIRSALVGLVRAANQQGGDFLHGRLESRYVLETIRNEHQVLGVEFRQALEHSVGARLVDNVIRDVQPASHDVAVFIPPTNHAFWNFQQECKEKYNVQVSLTGIPSLLSAPPDAYGCVRDAYQANYGDDTKARIISDSDLCTHALGRNIQRVYVLSDLYRREGNHLLVCDQ